MSDNAKCIDHEKKIDALNQDMYNNGNGIKQKTNVLWDWYNRQEGKKSKMLALNVIALVFSGLSSLSALTSIIVIISRG